jgi:arylsulfatase A-like enzyme
VRGVVAGGGIVLALLVGLFGMAAPAAAVDPPKTKITSGPAGPTADSTPTFTFKSDRAGAGFSCKLFPTGTAPGSTPFTTCNTGSYTPGSLPVGPYTFLVAARTQAGGFDRTPAKREFSVKSVAASTIASKPNVLLIVTDDQPALGTMQEMPTTLDFFDVAPGRRYRNAYVTTPICCPSRASIFSGQYAHNHGITIQDGTDFDPTKTWQKRLYDTGYFTGILGKYLNRVPTPKAPFFDVRRVWTADDIEKENRAIAKETNRFMRHAESVSGEDQRPWALVYATYSPHEPLGDAVPKDPKPVPEWNPPPSFGEKNLSDKHPSLEAIADQFDGKLERKTRRGQLRELQAVDESMAKVFHALGKYGETSDTLVIFMSDNGYFWGQHSLRGKQWPYLEGAHVPFLVRWPGHAPVPAAGDIVSNIDVAPTIFDAADVSPGYTVDGQSIFAATGWPRPWLLIENPTGDSRHPSWFASYEQDRHYISYPAQSVGGQSYPSFVENYNLLTDPWELNASNATNSTLQTQINSASTCAGSGCP